MLHRPDWHEPLTDRRWDEPWVRDAVAALVDDAVAAYDPDDLWPAHEWDGYRAALPLKNLYVGAAGMAWALARLEADAIDPAAVAVRALERFVAEPDFAEGEEHPQRRSALLVGETGIALVGWLLGGRPAALRERLRELVRANLGNDANELMWGVPGTLLAARALGDADAIRACEEEVRAARDPDGLWTQHVWGETFRALGPPHGLVGNVLALGEIGNAADVLRERATREGGVANWGTKLQWCDGAPGIVACSSRYLDEDLLLEASRLIWDAGPPERNEKGSGLCHGTAGNGHALLKTFERTGDELWLERARRFAVHALEQARALPPRYSLFTGGVGAAVFAVDCVDGTGAFPIVERAAPRLRAGAASRARRR
ncbi:MAG TPA: LanC-like protein [Gaiellaceae bacterium]|nr:LanC-like protein [Gaiellaceae bacterium]